MNYLGKVNSIFIIALLINGFGIIHKASAGDILSGTPRLAYVGGGYGTGVDVIDIDSMLIIATIPDAGGYRMVLSADGRKLYSTSGSTQLYVTDTGADTLIMAFNPSKNGVNSSELEGIAIHPDGSRIYVFDESSAAMFVIDSEADTVLNAVYLDLYEAENAVMSPDGQFVYVNDNDYVSKISTDTLGIADYVFVGSDGHGISISADGKKIYADGTAIVTIDVEPRRKSCLRSG